MVEDDCADGIIPLQNVNGTTLAEVITYLNEHAAEHGGSDEEKRKFDEEFVSDKDFDILFDLILAANYLEIKGLMDVVAQKIADIMANKSVKWVRNTFQIENDFTPEEEEEFRQANQWCFEGVDSDDD